MSKPEVETGFELQISIKEKETEKGIVFKLDGKRFELSRRTLKLALDTIYKITLICTPLKTIESLNIMGKGLMLEDETKKDQPQKGKEHLSSVYTCNWDTTGLLKATHRGAREECAIAIQGEMGSLKKVLQVKFYKKGDKNGDIGTEFESMVWKCDLDPEDTNENIVVDELFQ